MIFYYLHFNLAVFILLSCTCINMDISMYFSGGHVEFGETVSTNYNLFFF